MKLRNLKFKKKLILCSAVPIVLSLILLIVSNVQSTKIANEYDSMIKNQVDLRTNLLECRVINNKASRIVRDIVIDGLSGETTHYTENMATFNEIETQIQSYLKYVDEKYTGGDGKDTEYINALNAWIKEAENILSLAKSNQNERVIEELHNTCEPALENLTNIAQDLDDTVAQQVNDKSEELQTMNVITTISMIIMIFVGLVVIIFIVKSIIKSIIEPTTEIQKAIIAMSRGVLDTPVNYKSEDELGEMAEALRTSQFVLKQACNYITNVASAMANGKFDINVNANLPGSFASISQSLDSVQNKMNSMIFNIKRSVEQVSAGAEQVANGSQALAQGATEQASAVEELSSTINEISDGARQNAETAKVVCEKADQAGEQNQATQNKMVEMIEAMDDITEKSKEISKIIKTIEDIAFQTNILALNAAVEAARAGTAGKGFAVVADEVRNLATKSSEAAKNTTVLIEDSIHAVEKGSNIANQAAKFISTSTELTTEVVEKIAGIANAAERESEAIDQVTQGIDQIATVVQTNSATSEESAAASEELSSQANIMRQILFSFDVKEQNIQSFEQPVHKSQSTHISSPKTIANLETVHDDAGKY